MGQNSTKTFFFLDLTHLPKLGFDQANIIIFVHNMIVFKIHYVFSSPFLFTVLVTKRSNETTEIGKGRTITRASIYERPVRIVFPSCLLLRYSQRNIYDLSLSLLFSSSSSSSYPLSILIFSSLSLHQFSHTSPSQRLMKLAL